MATKIVGDLEIHTVQSKSLGEDGWRCSVFLHRAGNPDYIHGFNGRTGVHADLRDAEAEAFSIGEKMAEDYRAIQKGMSSSSNPP